MRVLWSAQQPFAMHLPYGKALLGTKPLEAEETEAEDRIWPDLEMGDRVGVPCMWLPCCCPQHSVRKASPRLWSRLRLGSGAQKTFLRAMQ